jgi:hypothetical protein
MAPELNEVLSQSVKKGKAILVTGREGP